VETASGVIVPRVEASGQVTVNMGAPTLRPRGAYALALASRRRLPTVRSGSRWAIPRRAVVDDVERAPVTTQGPRSSTIRISRSA
jgi:diaminopimelate epimerase